jgi:hypothetical protein
MDNDTTCLGRRGIQQISPDSGRRMNAKQQNEQRRHQRSAANARQADKQADAEAGSHIDRIDHAKTAPEVMTREVGLYFLKRQ